MPSRPARSRLAALVFALAALPGRAVAEGPGPASPIAKKLIEFGWDEPDPAFLRDHAEALERSPFDGCVFHLVAQKPGAGPENVAWLGWGRRALTEAELKASADDLRAARLRRVSANFLRFNTAPADLDWFDDHAAVVGNARLLARIAREGHCAGILLDVEQYQGKLFTYRTRPHADEKSWEEYAAQARRRGREVMDAFQEGFADLTVLLTFGYTLPLSETEEGKRPLSECRYGLLAPFLDGMVDAARGRARLVDGHELSYDYREAAQFADAYRLMTEAVRPIVAEPERVRRVVSAGFGIWLDYDSARRGWSETDPSKNYFTPEAFEASVRHALARSDEFVWVYTERPRWWTPEGGRRLLPDAYVSALRRARDAGRRVGPKAPPQPSPDGDGSRATGASGKGAHLRETKGLPRM